MAHERTQLKTHAIPGMVLVVLGALATIYGALDGHVTPFLGGFIFGGIGLLIVALYWD